MSPVKVGDFVHLGLATKGGAGFRGKLIKIEGDVAVIENEEGRTFKGPLKNLTVENCNSAFQNGRMKAKQEISNRIMLFNVAKIRGGGKGFLVVDGGRTLGDFSTYDEAVKFLTVGLKAQREAQDWHDDKKSFGALDARKAIRG